MARPDLAFALATGSMAITCWHAVVGSHVNLQLLGVRVRRRLPPRLLGNRVEVVWQVLGVRVPYLPAGGESCFSLHRC